MINWIKKHEAISFWVGVLLLIIFTVPLAILLSESFPANINEISGCIEDVRYVAYGGGFMTSTKERTIIRYRDGRIIVLMGHIWLKIGGCYVIRCYNNGRLKSIGKCRELTKI